MTVRDLAQRCGLAQETIRKIERGAVPTPALFTVAALADALRVLLDDLVQEAVALSASISRVDVAWRRKDSLRVGALIGRSGPLPFGRAPL